MANIDHYLEDIEVASRGEEVRDSIIDAFEALNSEGPGTMDWDNITDTPDTLTGYGVSEVPASMVSGVLALNNIPPSALERVVPVADDTARFALTSSDVQNGDTVKVLSTLKLYLVIDDTSLSTEAGYEEYRAGTADSVDWSGVLNTPDTLAGYGIEDAYTKDEVDDITTSEEVESDEGNPISIETDAAQYAKKTHLTLEPVQDLHGYDHPWPGGAEKNLFDQDTYSDSLSYPTSFSSYVYTEPITLKPNTQYAFYPDSNADLDSGLYFVLRGKDGDSFSAEDVYIYPVYNGSVTTNSVHVITTGSTGKIVFGLPSGSDLSERLAKIMSKNWQLEEGSTATAWEPYSNICPISGLDEVKVERTGKNLCYDDASHLFPRGDGLTIVENSETFTAYAKVKTNADYVFSCESEPFRKIAFGFDSKPAAGVICHSLTYTQLSTTAYKINSGNYEYIGFYYGATDHENANIMIEEGFIATSYEPYISAELSVDLPTIIYGGTLNLETGVLTVDRGAFNAKTVNWSDDGSGRVYTSLPLSPTELTTPLCSHCEYHRRPETGAYDNWIDWGGYPNSNKNLIVTLKGITDTLSQWNTYIQNNDVQFVYELATPITYQLTPQQLALFKGINNISTNAKTVQVAYRNGELATTGDIVVSTEIAKKSVLDEAASDTDAKLAPILGDLATAETSPASASHAVGEYLIYNNRLYKVLAAISAGQQLTIGTNIGQTNVAAELASSVTNLTLDSSLTVVGGGLGAYVEKQSSFCHMLLMAKLTDTDSPLPTETVVTTLPSQLRPKTYSIFFVYNWSTGDIVAKGYIHTNGSVYISGGAIPATNSILLFEGSYMV